MAFLVDKMLGGIQVPDDATPDDIEGALAPIRQQRAGEALRQNALSGLGGAIQEITRPPIQQFPKVSGRAAIAMGPNYQSFREGQLGQFAQQTAARQTEDRNMLAERQNRMQMIQQEKDRAQQLSFLSAKLSNDDKDRKLREKEAQRIAERDEAIRKDQVAKEKRGEFDPRTGLVTYPDPVTGALVSRVDPVAAARLAEQAAEENAAKLRQYAAARDASAGGGKYPLGSTIEYPLPGGGKGVFLVTGPNSGMPIDSVSGARASSARTITDPVTGEVSVVYGNAGSLPVGAVQEERRSDSSIIREAEKTKDPRVDTVIQMLKDGRSPDEIIEYDSRLGLPETNRNGWWPGGGPQESVEDILARIAGKPAPAPGAAAPAATPELPPVDPMTLLPPAAPEPVTPAMNAPPVTVPLNPIPGTQKDAAGNIIRGVVLGNEFYPQEEWDAMQGMGGALKRLAGG